MLKKVFIVLGLGIVVFLVVVALQPGTFQVTRAAKMGAPPDVVFAQVNDFHKWDAWSPWAKLDPAMTQTYEGAPSGTGAIYTWSGNNEVGAGRMTLTESRPTELIRIKLEFLKPMKSVNTTEFAFAPKGTDTEVTWSMAGTNNFIGKAFCLFMDMDKMVGGDFEKGLAQLRAVAEAATNQSVQVEQPKEH